MKRLKREFEEMQDTFDAEIIDGNYHHWKVVLCGPDATPYFGGTFLLDVNFPNEYPFDAPKVHFETKIYHPNIDHKGSLCLGSMLADWVPSTKIIEVISAIKKLLIEPNANDPLVPEIAKVFLTSHENYVKNATEWTNRYAM